MSFTNHSTNQLLRRYLNGAITAPEEAELERRARTDESLAEAMLGVQAFPEEDHTARVASMMKSARSQVPGNAVVRPLRRRLTRWAAAAAMLLLVGSAVFFLPRALEKTSGDLAMQTDSMVEPAPAPTPPAGQPVSTAAPAVEDEATESQTPVPVATSPQPTTGSASPLTGGNRPKDETIKQLAEADRRRQQKTDRATQRKVLTDNQGRTAAANARRAQAPPAVTPEARTETEAGADLLTEEAAEVTVEAAAPPPPAAPLSSPKISSPVPTTTESDDFSGTFSSDFIDGIVTNENGVPIKGALIRLPGQPIGELTDSLGFFRITANGVASLVEVTHPDYEAEEVELSLRTNDIQISLDRKEYQKKKPPVYAPDAGVTIIPWNPRPGYAKPEEGYGNLRRRIEENSPEGLPPGKYKFSFLVNTDGTLTDFEFRGQPDRSVMDYIGETMVRTSIWQIMEGEEPVRVYFKVEL